jgi:hypothetical protein
VSLAPHTFKDYTGNGSVINWPKILNESPVDWLLEESNPSVRYFTLHDILDKPEDNADVLATKKSIPKSIVVEKILGKMKPEGYWENPDNPYFPKYKSSYWTLMILARLGMDRTNDKVRKACEYLLSYQNNEGGFTTETQTTASREYEYRRKRGKELPSKNEFTISQIYENQLSCLTGNMVAAFLRMGYTEDDRIKKAIRWLVRIQNKDGGWLCPYWKAHAKDKHGCFMGTICPMEAFSEIPRYDRTEEVKKAISNGAEFLLMHRLFKGEHHNFGIINRSWLQMSFPWFGYSILRSLDVLTRLDYRRDERINDAIEILLKKRNKDGTWILENSPISRMQANLETKGKPSKWITLIALRVLKRLASSA